MKENLLGPRQWAFVVITGGAACALPFLQKTDSSPTPTDNSLTRTDTGLTSSPHDGQLPARFALDSSAGALVVPGSVADLVTHLPQSRLPEWANANRSPFDDLVGVTAAKPESSLPKEQPVMQPLRPWIASPTESGSLVSTTTPSEPGASSSPRASVGEDAIAQGPSRAFEASPWSEEPANYFTPIDQLATTASGSPPGAATGWDPSARWPDQAVSAEELVLATRLREPALASTVVSPPRRPTDHTSALLAAPALPVAAQRTGETYLPPAADALPPQPTQGEPPAVLPPTRTPHLIYQPGIWK